MSATTNGTSRRRRASITSIRPTTRRSNMISGYEDGTRNGPHVFKLSGMYQLPWDITASANYNGAFELPVQSDDRHRTRANGLGTATINLTPQNT